MFVTSVQSAVRGFGVGSMAEIVVRSSNLENISVGKLSTRMSASGTRVLGYRIDLRHNKMNLYRELTASELFILQSKVDVLVANWDEKYLQFKAQSRFRTGKDAADDLTASAQARLEVLKNILRHTLTIDDATDWESLKDHTTYPMPDRFSERQPVSVAEPEPVYVPPNISFLDWLFGYKAAKISDAEARHALSLDSWRANEVQRTATQLKSLAAWQERKAAFWSSHEIKKAEFLENQMKKNAQIDSFLASVIDGDEKAVAEHAAMVLESSDYHDLFQKSFEIEYDVGLKLIKVAYELPSPDNMPKSLTHNYPA